MAAEKFDEEVTKLMTQIGNLTGASGLMLFVIADSTIGAYVAAKSTQEATILKVLQDRWIKQVEDNEHADIIMAGKDPHLNMLDAAEADRKLN